jgi:hypothetical protein
MFNSTRRIFSCTFLFFIFLFLQNVSLAQVFYRINAGGGKTTNEIGTFAADDYYTPATSNSHYSAEPISSIINPFIYRYERNSSTRRLTYSFPVSNGDYKVVLHFAEIFVRDTGKRVFDVEIEGTKVLDNYDIVKKVGVNTATTEYFTTSVTDDTLTVYFSSLAADGGVYRPLISAIEVTSPDYNDTPVVTAGPDKTIIVPRDTVLLNGAAVDPDGSISSMRWTQISGPSTAVFSDSTIAAPTVSGLMEGVYVFRVAATDNLDAPSKPATVSVTVKAITEGTSAYRINAGGPKTTNQLGTFEADAYYSPVASNIYYSSAPITASINPFIYRYQRNSATGKLNYTFPVANGQYKVVLHFAEIFFSDTGKRVFDVSIEGTKVLDDYDIVKMVGANTGTSETYTVDVTDDTLNIYLSSLAQDGGVYRPCISAIEVINLSLLPVHLTSFTATINTKQVLLKWSSTNELNFDHYEVQHSTNANTFNTIERVAADNSANNIKWYSTIHANPAPAENFYRLKMVDRNGTYAYSPIRMILFNKEAVVTAYPNPFLSSLNIIGMQDNSTSTVTVINISGQRIVQKTFKGFTQLNAVGWNPGTYIVQVNTGNKVQSFKVQKQR